MKCSAALRLIDLQLDGELAPGALAAFASHRAACAECQAAWDAAVELSAALAALPVVPPRPGFEARVLLGSYLEASRATTTPAAPAPRGILRRWAAAGAAVALAASLLVAVGWWRTPASIPEVMARADEPLRLIFHSETALRGVTIELALPLGTVIRGHPGKRQLSWQSDLLLGMNVLELPLDVAGSGGVLVATISHGGERRAFKVRVQPPVTAPTDGAHDA